MECMKFVRGDSLSEIYGILAKELLSCPEVSVRGLKTRELLSSGFVLEDCTRIFDLKERARYLYGEILWYHAGGFTLDGIAPFSSFWEKISDEDKRVQSNYGHRIFRTLGGFWKALHFLIKDKYTRQAIVHINTPESLSYHSKDIPCTVYLQFFIRDERLHLDVKMRSNDIWKGLCFDAPSFIVFLQEMYLFLKPYYPDLKLGSYFHTSGSLHVYEPDYERILTLGPSSIPFQLKAPLVRKDGMPVKDVSELYHFVLSGRPDQAVEGMKRLFKETDNES